MLAQNMTRLFFIMFAVAVWTIGSGIMIAEAIWPFDQGNSSQQTNQTGNQSSTVSNSTSPSQSASPGYQNDLVIQLSVLHVIGDLSRSLPSACYIKFSYCYFNSWEQNKHCRKEIEESKKQLSTEKDDSTHKRDLAKRIQLINWVLENMNNPDTRICVLFESKMNEIILSINWTHLNFIFYYPKISSFINEKSINGDFKNAIIFY